MGATPESRLKLFNKPLRATTTGRSPWCRPWMRRARRGRPQIGPPSILGASNVEHNDTTIQLIATVKPLSVIAIGKPRSLLTIETARKISQGRRAACGRPLLWRASARPRLFAEPSWRARSSGAAQSVAPFSRLDGPTSELFAPVGRPRAGMQRALHEMRHDLPMRKHTVSLRVGEYGAQRRASAAGRPSRLSRPRQNVGETRCVTKECAGA